MVREEEECVLEIKVLNVFAAIHVLDKHNKSQNFNLVPDGITLFYWYRMMCLPLTDLIEHRLVFKHDDDDDDALSPCKGLFEDKLPF